jgi:hypothetical protein
MIDREGHVVEERRKPEHPQVGGKRWYDMPRLPVKTILVWMTVAAMLISGVSKCMDWFGWRVADVGPAAEFRRLNTRLDSLVRRDSAGQIERERLRASQDTIKEAMVLFAEQLCDRQRIQLSLGARRRCDLLFPNGADP